MIQLESKVCLISGAASGIGAATARAMVGAGGRVMIGDIADLPGKALAAAVEALKAAAPASIVNVSSVAGLAGMSGLRGYTACGPP